MVSILKENFATNNVRDGEDDSFQQENIVPTNCQIIPDEESDSRPFHQMKEIRAFVMHIITLHFNNFVIKDPPRKYRIRETVHCVRRITVSKEYSDYSKEGYLSDDDGGQYQ